MRILLIGKSHLKLKGKRHAFYDTRLYNGLIRNNHWVYFFSPKEEERLSFSFGMGWVAKRKAQQNLFDVVKTIQPDVLICSHANILDEETVFNVRKLRPSLRIAHINVDAFFSPVNYKHLTEIKKWTDCIFMTTGGSILHELSNARGRAFFIPNITDNSIDTGCAFLYDDLPYDLSCFMHANKKLEEYKERLDLIDAIDKKIPRLKTFYAGFNPYPETYGADYINKMGQSSMSLNINRKMCSGIHSTHESRFLYSSDRIAHIMGNGSLAFTQQGFGLDKIYTEEEIIFFNDKDELIDKIIFYKKNPSIRKRIARKGWEKAHSFFNERVIVRYILETLFDEEYSQNYIWKNNI